MHVQYVVLCEHVIIANDGRPSLIGVFNDMQVPSAPFTLPRLAFVARLHFTSDELDATRRVEVVITNPQGVEMGRPGGDITLPPAPPDAESVTVDLPLHFDLFQLPQEGRYTFVLHVDGKAVAGTQLNVRPQPVGARFA